MTFLDMAIYIIGAMLTGGIVVYPIAFLHGQLNQSHKVLEAEFATQKERIKSRQRRILGE